jgi:alkanesulfonate monooxygenase SsuD/methylene tetrahydromethanopterin reductase-like flavin-dependent oxidoreductase (luciferase family)
LALSTNSKPVGLFTEASINGIRDIHDYYNVLAQEIILADQLGFDFYSTTQSYGLDWPESTFSITPDPIALFASCASRTQRIKFLTGILIAAFHHPAITLSNIASLDQISNGRAMLGVGRGHPWLFDRLGFDQASSREKLHDFCMMTAQILANPTGRHTIEGKHWRTKEFELMPPLISRNLEVYVAATASAESAIEAARAGFGILIPAYVGLPIEMAESAISVYQEEHKKVWGRKGKHQLGVQLYADADCEKAQELGALALAGQFKVFSKCMLSHASSAGGMYPAYKDIGTFMGTMADLETCRKTVNAEWPRYMAIWGDAKQCLSRLKDVIGRLQPSGLILNIDSGGIPFEEIAGVMRYTSSEILPGIRKLLASYD